MTTPFQIDELLARLRALGRRAVASVDDPVVRFGDIELDLATKTITRTGARVHLTPRSGGCWSSSRGIPELS